MARHFNQAANDRITYLNAGPESASIWTTYTVAVALRRTANFTGTTMNVLSSRSNGFDRHNIHLDDFDDNASLIITSPSFSFCQSVGLTYTVAEGWMIMAATKTAGTTTPIFYKYVWGTNTWTSQAANSTLLDGDEGGNPGWTVSGYNNVAGFDGDIAAAAFWNGRVWSPDELKRLSDGMWGRWRPDVLFEFPNGRDDPAGIPHELSRRHGTTGSVLSGTSRAAVNDPPGFRFSGLTRRR